MKLHTIQSEIKAPKGQFNQFGKYKYRSCEDILEAAKPVLLKHGFSITLTDDIVEIGGRIYVKSTATITDGKETYSAIAFAREEESKKGMDAAQITGACGSYSRKYALNGLLALDDTKDADAINQHDEVKETAKPATKPLITDKQFSKLISRIQAGEKEAGELAKKAFTFDSEQWVILNENLK
jgi:hypothetical protein